MKLEHQRALARVAAADRSGVWLPAWSEDPALEELATAGLVWGGERPRLTPKGRAAAGKLPGGFRQAGA